MKFCPKCKREHFNNDNYCVECGMLLIKKKDPKCDECDHFIYGDYCTHCGQKVTKAELKNA